MNYIQLITISFAVASISYTISKSSIFYRFRYFIKNHSDFFGELFSCPYCLSHWISFFFCLNFYPLNVSFIVSVCAIVTLSIILVGFIQRALDFLISSD